MVAKLTKFGADVSVSPTNTYISLKRGNTKFGIVQPSSAEHIDIGIKLKGIAPRGRLEEAGTWSQMVTHRIRISDPKQIDAEVFAWLKQAYENQKEKKRSRKSPRSCGSIPRPKTP